jgi:hypothetical protein
LYPLPNVATEHRDGNTSETCRITLQTPQGSVQQTCGSQGIITVEVVERGGYLNQPLQKRLIWLLRFQPHGFPRFVRSEELTCIVTA